MHHRISGASALLAGLVFTASAKAETATTTPKPMDMREKMHVCAQMHDDKAHHRPMSTAGMALMTECQRMNKEMSTAPAATLNR